MMTVLRIYYDDRGSEQALDVRPSDVVGITTQSDEIFVEIDGGERSDNYTYLGDHVEFIDRNSDSNVRLQ